MMTMSKKIYMYPSVEVMDVITSDMMSFTDPSTETPDTPLSGAPAHKSEVF